MTGSWYRPGIAVFLTTGLVFCGFLVVNSGILYLEQNEASRERQDNLLWRTNRLLPDLGNLVHALYEFNQPETDMDHGQVMLRLEILWSRLDTLDQGEAMEVFSGIERANEIIGNAKAKLRTLEKSISSLDESAPQNAVAMARLVAGMEQSFSDLGVDLLHYYNAIDNAERERLASRIRLLVYFMIGVILCSVITLLLWLLENRRALQAARLCDLALQDARQANAAKSKFLANTSHELRTPLNAILGFSHVMRDEMLGPMGNPRYNDYVNNIHESGLHLLKLINDLLDLAEIEAGKRGLQNEGLDVRTIVESSIALSSSHFGRSEKGIDNLCPADLPTLRADPQALRQILVNLLVNAAKFSRPGGIVTVNAALRPGGGLHLWIKDTGFGMTKDQLERALLPFKHSDHDMNRTLGGTGLGLPISKSLMELHGGSLHLASEPGQGTTVTLYFPDERVINQETSHQQEGADQAM